MSEKELPKLAPMLNLFETLSCSPSGELPILSDKDVSTLTEQLTYVMWHWANESAKSGVDFSEECISEARSVLVQWKLIQDKTNDQS
jgi:hypothetical protein